MDLQEEGEADAAPIGALSVAIVRREAAGNSSFQAIAMLLWNRRDHSVN